MPAVYTPRMSCLAFALGLSLLAVQQKTTTSPIQGSLQGVTAPVAIKTVNPKYPHSFFHRPPAGDATIQLKIDMQGLPQDVVLIKSTGSDELDASALEAVRQYRFKPAMKDGDPIAVVLKVEVHFRRY